MNLIRIYADAAGESHFEQCDLKLTLKEFAPPVAPHGGSAFAGWTMECTMRSKAVGFAEVQFNVSHHAHRPVSLFPHTKPDRDSRWRGNDGSNGHGQIAVTLRSIARRLSEYRPPPERGWD